MAQFRKARQLFSVGKIDRLCVLSRHPLMRPLHTYHLSNNLNSSSPPSSLSLTHPFTHPPSPSPSPILSLLLPHPHSLTHPFTHPLLTYPSHPFSEWFPPPTPLTYPFTLSHPHPHPLSEWFPHAGMMVDPQHGPLYHAYGNMELRRNNVTGARDVLMRGVITPHTTSLRIAILVILPIFNTSLANICFCITCSSLQHLLFF